MSTGVAIDDKLMTPFQLSHVSAISVLLPLAAAIWKRHAIWRKFSLLVITLLIGGLIDLMNYFLIIKTGTNTVTSNVYQLVEFVLLVWLFKKWPSARKSHFHVIILITGIAIWCLENCILFSLSHNGSLFRVLGSVLLVYVCVDQINYTIINRQGSIILSQMLIKVGFVIYFFYKAFIESFELFPIRNHYPYYAQFWYIQCCVSILLNVLITIAFLCYRKKPTHSILTWQD